MLSLPVTLTIAAGAALVNIWLMIRCGQARTKESVSVGDGGNEFVIRRMRATPISSKARRLCLCCSALWKQQWGRTTGCGASAFSTSSDGWRTDLAWMAGHLAKGAWSER